MKDNTNTKGLNRVDGRRKVTGGALYSADYKPQGMVYAVLAGSTIAKGTVLSVDTKAAEKAPGVLKVITHFNCPEIPGYKVEPGKKEPEKGTYKLFYNNKILFYGQPVAVVVADTFERALYASSLIKAQYRADTHETNLRSNFARAFPPEGAGVTSRGIADAWKTAPFKTEQEYVIPSEIHNPMELHAIIAKWDAADKLTVWDKTQGVKDTQDELSAIFKLPKENIQVNSEFVGGAFGGALQVWQHEVAAAVAAKVLKRPVKLVLSRADMFTSVGYRPHTWQKIGIGAGEDGKLIGITHEAIGQTSTYEDFNEGPIGVSKSVYACPNVNTIYKIAALDVGSPTWMRGPGEATGTFALESAMDELSYLLNIDPIELRLRNYAETDPESGKPFSSKFLKEAYEMGAKQIGWHERSQKPGSVLQNGWLTGYGLSGGIFGAYRDHAAVQAVITADGKLTLLCSVSDIGPGTSTMMASVATDVMGISPENIIVKLGSSALPYAPQQGGSSITATVGSAVNDACKDLKEKFQKLAGNGGSDNPDYVKILKDHHLNQLSTTIESKGGPEADKYAMYSWSVHFVKVKVHPATGVVKMDRVVCVADCGHIVSPKTARSQVIGGAIMGIGMALMEDTVIDHRYGKIVNNNFADYHVPVQADIPQIESLFVNKPDPYINALGAKGMGEIALIGMAGAVTNAVYNATGKRIRELPVTPDKILQAEPAALANGS
jgi:xanthine dehydrogenase YagR molybdenum-binding subunit